MPLASTALQIKAMQLGDPRAFPFVEPPPGEHLAHAMQVIPLFISPYASPYRTDLSSPCYLLSNLTTTPCYFLCYFLCYSPYVTSYVTPLLLPIQLDRPTRSREANSDVHLSLQALRQLQALSADEDEEVLPLGAVLSQLPVDLPMGKLPPPTPRKQGSRAELARRG